MLSRRSFCAGLTLPVLPSLVGCASPLPLTDAVASAASDPAAEALLRESADAHGWAAYGQLNDINVAYRGKWAPLIDRIQPEVVDAGYRQRSEERVLPHRAINAQYYEGPKGRKYVVWRRGTDALTGRARVWFNGMESADQNALQAAALVAEGYGLFLLGPLWLAGRQLPVTMGREAVIDGVPCNVVHVQLAPGLGHAERDKVALYIDCRNRLTRRVRFTLEGFPSTQGAVAEVDFLEQEKRFGIVWPMRSVERVLHPIALLAHDWRITGLDVNRGYGEQALLGPSFEGEAVAPARPIGD
jgi:hypothetical protein